MLRAFKLLSLVLAILPALLVTLHWHQPECGAPQTCQALSAAQASNLEQIQKRYLTEALTLWQQADFQQATDFFKLAAESGSEIAKVYHFYTMQWLTSQHEPTRPTRNSLPWADGSCRQQVLFVTSELSSLPQAAEFISRFNRDPRLQQLPICIAPTVEFVPELLHCSDVDANTRISCNIAPLASRLKDRQFTHLVIFTRQGKANVHNGIMYLDQKDSYDVLIHELAHFAGFVDEYPLSEELAERICQGVEAPNLVFQQAGQSQPDTHYWQQLGQSDKAPLSAAQTCNNHTTQAFKLSADMTFMQYHDLRRIPDTYLAAWQAALGQNRNITPAFINFAQLYEQQHDDSAHYWRARYQAFLNKQLD